MNWEIGKLYHLEKLPRLLLRLLCFVTLITLVFFFFFFLTYSACHISVNLLYYLGGVFVNFYFSTSTSFQEIWSERGYSR